MGELPHKYLIEKASLSKTSDKQFLPINAVLKAYSCRNKGGATILFRLVA